MVKRIDKNIIRNLYKSYQEKCVNESLAYINFGKFKKIHKKAREMLLSLASKNSTSKVPYCIVKIDDNWLYWVEIVKDDVVVNFITPEQFKYLFFNELKGNQEEVIE